MTVDALTSCEPSHLAGSTANCRRAGLRYDQRVIELRSRDEIEAMRPAGRFVAAVLVELAERIRVGLNVLELDRIAHAMIREHGATSCYIDYHPSFGAMPFGKVLCVSVNDAVLHGLPHDRRLRDGDLVSLDFAAEVDGWVADSSTTIPVGTPRNKDLHQIQTAEQALAAGIAAAQPGNRLGDVSAAIGRVIRGAGYQVNTAFGGHGVGRVMHGPPDVPNDGVAGRGLSLQPGIVIAIEPWFLAGSPRIVTDRDGWTIRSVDRSRGVHVEHTVAITVDGPLVLTARDAASASGADTLPIGLVERSSG
jgi:methionyl aminopeptidase